MRKKIRAEAVRMAHDVGLVNLTREDLCVRVGIKDGSFFGNYEGTFGELIEDIKNECPMSVDGAPLTRLRLTPEMRRDHLMSVALEMAQEEGGYLAVTVKTLSERAGVTSALVSSYYGDRVALHRAIMRRAIELEDLDVIAQGIASRNAMAMGVSAELKERVLAHMAVEWKGI